MEKNRVQLSAELTRQETMQLLEAVSGLHIKITLQIAPADTSGGGRTEGATPETKEKAARTPVRKACEICACMFTAPSGAAKYCPSCKAMKKTAAEKKEADA